MTVTVSAQVSAAVTVTAGADGIGGAVVMVCVGMSVDVYQS